MGTWRVKERGLVKSRHPTRPNAPASRTGDVNCFLVVGFFGGLEYKDLRKQIFKSIH